MDTIYLDHNATTPIHPEVVETMARCYAQDYANPASQHRPGQAARGVLEAAREQIAAILGADLAAPRRDRLVLTSGGTEANNLAILGMAAAGGGRPGQIIISLGEHPSVIEPAERLLEQGWRLDTLGLDAEGVVRAEQLPPLLVGPANGPAGDAAGGPAGQRPMPMRPGGPTSRPVRCASSASRWATTRRACSNRSPNWRRSAARPGSPPYGCRASGRQAAAELPRVGRVGHERGRPQVSRPTGHRGADRGAGRAAGSHDVRRAPTGGAPARQRTGGVGRRHGRCAGALAPWAGRARSAIDRAAPTVRAIVAGGVARGRHARRRRTAASTD